MWHFHKVTREGHRTARDLFRRACTADPDLRRRTPGSAGLVPASSLMGGAMMLLPTVARVCRPRPTRSRWTRATLCALLVRHRELLRGLRQHRHSRCAELRSISIRASRSAISCSEWRDYSTAMQIALSHRCVTVSRSILMIRRTSRGTSCWPTPNCSAICLIRRSKAQTGRWRCVPCSVRRSRRCAAAPWRLGGAMRRDGGVNV